MIVKIQPANPNVIRAVEYNEKKMDGEAGVRDHETAEELMGIEDGHVLATRNVPEGGTLLGEFERLKILNLKTAKRGKVKNPAFHMSVNPSETDRKLSEQVVVQFVDDVMECLGYKDQPYRIYKHTDIERVHYHVVSSRCGQDGKKINDSFERLVLRQNLKRLAPKYGFTVVLNEEEKEEERKAQRRKGAQPEPETEVVFPEPEEPKKKPSEKKPAAGADKEKKVVPPFKRDSATPLTRQITDAFEDAITWHFSTFEQIQGLMLRRYNVLLEIERAGDGERIVASGTSPDGKPVTPILKETELGVEMLRRIRERCGEANMSARKEQRKRLETLAAAAAAKAQSYEEFRSIMAKKGTYVVLSWTRTREPFGVTYLDRATRCAWKGSETGTDFKWLKTVVEKKGWTLTRDSQQATVEKHSRMPSRRARLTVRRDTVRPNSVQLSQPLQIPRVAAAGSHHPLATSMAKAKGESIYDESLRLGEEEEREKKRAEKKQNYGPSF